MIAPKLKTPLCNIPARTLPPCDQPWGHPGMMHQNAGDGFYAREWEKEHKRRQKAVTAKAKKSKNRRYLVSAMFDIEATSMESAKVIADRVLEATKKPYVRVKDKDSQITYEHLANGKWKKVKR